MQPFTQQTFITQIQCIVVSINLSYHSIGPMRKPSYKLGCRPGSMLTFWHHQPVCVCLFLCWPVWMGEKDNTKLNNKMFLTEPSEDFYFLLESRLLRRYQRLGWNTEEESHDLRCHSALGLSDFKVVVPEAIYHGFKLMFNVLYTVAIKLLFTHLSFDLIFWGYFSP